MGAGGGYMLYSKRKKKRRLDKYGKILAKEQAKLEEFEQQDEETLKNMFRKKGDKHIQYALAMKVEDPKESEQFMRGASSHGHANAAFQLGHRFLVGRYQPQSEDVALDFFICAAERGHDDAMVAAGDIYYQREQWKEAKKYYKMASDLEMNLAHSDWLLPNYKLRK